MSIKGKQLLLPIFKKANIIAHIAGASGSGKSTLLQELQREYPKIKTEDLDLFDELATKKLKFPPKFKTEYTDAMLLRLANKRQELMDKWVKKQKHPIVLGGHHIEGKYKLNIPTENKFLLNTPAWLSVWRAYKRSQKEESQYRRRLLELPQDYLEARRDIKQFKHLGYTGKNKNQIKELIAQILAKEK